MERVVMTVTALEGFRYRLPLTEPLQLGGRVVRGREGVLVRAIGSGGAVGWGDVAPLPGFSSESLNEAVPVLQAVSEALCGQPAHRACAQVPFATRMASVRFGMELALCTLEAAAQQVTLPHVLGEVVRPIVPFNALVTGTGEAARVEVERAREAGYQAVKLKVGRRPVEEDAALVRRLSGHLGPMALRLDANRAWSMAEALRFAEAVRGMPIAYIEEPLADASQLPRFAAESGLPVALDETLQEGDDPADHPYATAVVVKPTLAGGLLRARRLAHAALEQGIMPVLSAAYESGIGLRGLVALAAALPGADVPVGLDTYRRLRTDVLRPRLSLRGPSVHVPTLMATRLRVHEAVLEPIFQCS